MAKVIKEQEGKKNNKFQGFLLVVVIPLFFAITVTLVILTFLGINVFEKAESLSEKVPFLSTLRNEDPGEAEADYESEIISLEASIKDQEVQIENLENQLAEKDDEVSRVGIEKQRLQEEIDELVAIQEENKRAFDDIVKTYETISPNKSANIITNMTQDEAIKILTNLKSETLAAIMEKMEPTDAAKYTELLTNE